MTVPPRTADDVGVAEIRERFLTAGSVEPSAVREAILASWWRSRQSNVDADRVEPRFTRDPNLDTPLTRSAEPVLRHLRDQLDGQAVSIILTDPSGLVLTRLTADAELERHLDRVHLVPGFSYAEEFVGTNGIGTALESGRSTHVFGHEHYAEHLESLACAGVPIRHPVSGKTVGAVDLTCWRRDAGPLLVTLAKSTAEQIRQALLTETGMREIELLHEYLRASRRSSGMVFALNNDVVMMNEVARSTLDPGDQAALLKHAAEALADRHEVLTVDLPTGLTVRLNTRLVDSAGRVAGGVVHVKVVDHVAGHGDTGAGHMLLPGVVGTGTLWRRACSTAETVRRRGDWLVLEGEPGVGKAALARALHQRVSPSGRFVVLDGATATSPTWLAEARTALSAADGTVVLRHLHLLGRTALRTLAAALPPAEGGGTAWVVACVEPGQAAGDLGALLRALPSTVVVPPLRHHVEDVQQLVPFLLRRLGYNGKLTCSSEAMQVLQRSSWPGNVEQLLQVLRQVVQTRRTGVIGVGDLPPDTGSLSRRLLSTLEAMERDAIVRALLDAQGNKAEAARAVGMSRATIYRKIHEYGIVTGPVAGRGGAGLREPHNSGSVADCPRTAPSPRRGDRG